MSDNGKKEIQGTNGFIKGNKLYHSTQGHKYTIKFDTSRTTAVNVLDKTARNGRMDWVLRLDRPHAGAPFDHVNINPGMTGIPDPHLPLPPGGIAVGKGTAKVCKVINKVNKVAVPLALAVDAVQTGMAIKDDLDNGTSRNTVETVAGIAGGWGGGAAGAAGGAALGTMIFPVVGTIAGGIIGAIGGGIGGSLGASYATEKIGDACDYDVVERKCKRCGKWFKARLYKGESDRRLCDRCWK